MWNTLYVVCIGYWFTTIYFLLHYLGVYHKQTIQSSRKCHKNIVFMFIQVNWQRVISGKYFRWHIYLSLWFLWSEKCNVSSSSFSPPLIYERVFFFFFFDLLIFLRKLRRCFCTRRGVLLFFVVYAHNILIAYRKTFSKQSFPTNTIFGTISRLIDPN